MINSLLKHSDHHSRLMLVARFVSILLIVFCSEILADLILPRVLPFGSMYAALLADSIFLLFISGPFIWLILIRPFRDMVLLEKAQFEHLYLLMVDSVVILDENNRITACNPAAEKLFGVSSADIAGELINRLIECSVGCNLFDPPTLPGDDTLLMHCQGIGADDRRIPLTVSSSYARFIQRQVKVLIIRDMSAVKESELTLESSLSLLSTTLESTADGIIATSWDHEVKVYNQQFADLFGLSDEQLDDPDYGTVFTTIAGMMQDPHAFRSGIERLYKDHENRSHDILQMADGRSVERYSQLLMINGVAAGRVWSFRDITDRVNAEQKLLESEDRFRMIFDKSEDAIFLLTPGTSTVIDMNETAEKMYGYAKHELIGSPFNRFRTDGEFLDFIHAACLLREHESCQQDNMVNLRKDGTEIHLSLRAKIIRLQGRDAIYCTMRDISRRLRMEEEARSIQSQLIHSNKMTSLGLLVAGIAHEINNPNNYIMANAQMLYQIWKDLDPLLQELASERGDFVLGGLPYSKLETSLPEMITAINEGSRRIKNIIGGLKNYSRKGGPVLEPMDINRAVYAAMLLLNHHIRRYTDNFVLDLADGLPQVKGSSQQLEQVIINLVMNALQSLASRDKKLEIRSGLSTDGQSVQLIITDEGCGIPEGVFSKVMEPFFTTRLDSGGTGLGLSIARSIIQSHNGDIEMSNRPTGGTIVTVTLPAH